MIGVIASVPHTVNAQSNTPVCSSAASDSDGDGWGWENSRSCIVDSSIPANSSSPANSSTPVISATPVNTSAAASTSGFPACSSSQFDSDGDGYGWENDRTCIVGSASANNSQNGTPSSTVSNNNTGSSQDNSGLPVCASAGSDPDGDGYGWENSRSCVVSANTNSNNTSSASNRNDEDIPPPPVAAALPGNSNGRPVCLTDASDVNNSGFGYEFNRTCVVQPGVTATRNNPLLNRRICEDWFEIPYGDFRLQNNVWNSDAVFSNNWAQCITLSGSASQPVASWDYNWLGRFDGNEYSVKSYPQVYYGRKTRFNQSGSVAETGLPAPLGSIPQYTIDFAYSETGNAERNVAFESFFHTSCEAEENNKQFELMVWVGKPDIRTPGPIVTTARIDGRDWDVHVNPTLGWGYVAFVAQTPFNSGRLNWNAFVDWTRNSGPAFGVPSIANNTCMGAIELGTETFWGAGTFTIDRLNVSRR